MSTHSATIPTTGLFGRRTCENVGAAPAKTSQDERTSHRDASRDLGSLEAA